MKLIERFKNLFRKEGKVSDGYHTFEELYGYRKEYNAAFFNVLGAAKVYNVHKSKRHADGELCFGGGWFVVMADLPTGQISNHYPISDWDKFFIPETGTADRWDGHTPQEALQRLAAYNDMAAPKGAGYRPNGMSFRGAIRAMYQGHKVKLPEWRGYWFVGSDGLISVMTKDGRVTKTPWFGEYLQRLDWKIVAEQNGDDESWLV